MSDATKTWLVKNISREGKVIEVPNSSVDGLISSLSAGEELEITTTDPSQVRELSLLQMKRDFPLSVKRLS